MILPVCEFYRVDSYVNRQYWPGNRMFNLLSFVNSNFIDSTVTSITTRGSKNKSGMLVSDDNALLWYSTCILFKV